jgi:hypothetical protein
MMTQAQLDAIALFNRRKEAQQAGAEAQAGALDADCCRRAPTAPGGAQRSSSGRSLIAGAGDVNAAAAAASAEYAHGALVDSHERGSGRPQEAQRRQRRRAAPRRAGGRLRGRLRRVGRRRAAGGRRRRAPPSTASDRPRSRAATV